MALTTVYLGPGARDTPRVKFDLESRHPMSTTNTRTIRLDDEADPITVTIVQAVAVIQNTPPLELPPLNEYVDVDAVERAMDLTESPSFEGGEFTFTYVGVKVTVDFDGELQLEWV